MDSLSQRTFGPRHLAEKSYVNVMYRTTDPVLPSTVARRLKGFQTEAKARGLRVSVNQAQSAWLDDAEPVETLIGDTT